MSVAGTGARIVAGQTLSPEWTRPGPVCRWIELRVDREPANDGALRGSPKPEPLTLGHGRLSPRTLWGACWRQGPGASPRGLQRLDLDGWLVRSETDTCKTDRPAAQNVPTHETRPCTLPTRRRPRLRQEKSRLLDTGLLMGGNDRRLWPRQKHPAKPAALHKNSQHQKVLSPASTRLDARDLRPGPRDSRG
jgi:hypothetical protein